jgi:hypothetical protein
MSYSFKESGLFSPIRERGDALTLINYAAKGFYFVAAIQIVVGFLVLPSAILDGCLYAVFGFFLHKFQSRTAAVLLLLLSAAAMLITVANRLGISEMGGTNIFLAALVLVMSVRAVEATFKLHGRLRQTRSVPGYTSAPEPPVHARQDAPEQVR